MFTYKQWKFTGLLTALVVLNLGRVASIAFFHQRIAMDLLGVAFLVFATASLCIDKRSRTIALLLGIPSVSLTMIGRVLSGDAEHGILIAGRAATTILLAFTIVIVLRTLLTQSKVTRDTIAGAFCGYILIGVIFAEAYTILEILQPDSFQTTVADSGWSTNSLDRWLMLEYFSFITLSTLGFGDIIPATPMARSLVIWEALSGQFYLAVLVAGLVNLRGNSAPTTDKGTSPPGQTVHSDHQRAV